MKQYLYNLATDKSRGVFASCMKFILLVLSIIYGLIVRALILFYGFFPRRIKCRVISVGNITLGGTGKSSLVEFIARFLHQQGKSVAVLSRGYKRVAPDKQTAAASFEEMGDEPYMLKTHLPGVPVIVDPDRIKSADRAIRDFGADIVILDDGFQQWKIKKDLEIVTIDSTNPMGNGHLLPRGILREPLSSLKRADVFVLTKTNLSADIEKLKYFLSSLNPEAEILESIHKPSGLYRINGPEKIVGLDFVAGKKVILFCGIGDPESFGRLIKSIGGEAVFNFRFPDHHNYTKADLDEIVGASKNKDIKIIITTEKDAVRLGSLAFEGTGIEVFALRIEQAIKDEQRLYYRLHKLHMF